MYGVQLQCNDVSECNDEFMKVGEGAKAAVQDTEVNDRCERSSEGEYVGMWSSARPVKLRKAEEPYIGKQSARETQWKDVNKWLLFVVREVELAEVTIEVSRFPEVDETRDTIEILEVKDLKAIPTFQEPSTCIAPCTAS